MTRPNPSNRASIAQGLLIHEAVGKIVDDDLDIIRLGSEDHVESMPQGIWLTVRRCKVWHHPYDLGTNSYGTRVLIRSGGIEIIYRVLASNTGTRKREVYRSRLSPGWTEKQLKLRLRTGFWFAWEAKKLVRREDALTEIVKLADLGTDALDLLVAEGEEKEHSPEYGWMSDADINYWLEIFLPVALENHPERFETVDGRHILKTEVQ